MNHSLVGFEVRRPPGDQISSTHQSYICRAQSVGCTRSPRFACDQSLVSRAPQNSRRLLIRRLRLIDRTWPPRVACGSSLVCTSRALRAVATTSSAEDDEGESCDTRSRTSPPVSRRRLSHAKVDDDLRRGQRRGTAIMLRTNRAEEEDRPGHFGDEEN